VANYNCGEYFKKDCKKLIQGQIIEVETILITKLEIGEEQIMMKHIKEIEIKTMETLNFDPDISNMKIIDYIQNGQNQSTKKGNYIGAEDVDNDSVCFIGIRDKFTQSKSNIITFFIDSGCTDHLINDTSYFNDLIMLKNLIKIVIAKDRDYIEAIGVGNIDVLSYVTVE